MANRCCAIELEPKTLNQGQISHAWEVAVGIFQKAEPTEAPTIFVQGMRQDVSVEDTKEAAVMNAKLHPKMVQGCENTATSAERLPDCSCMQPAIESPDEAATRREPLTAPF